MPRAPSGWASSARSIPPMSCCRAAWSWPDGSPPRHARPPSRPSGASCWTASARSATSSRRRSASSAKRYSATSPTTRRRFRRVDQLRLIRHSFPDQPELSTASPPTLLRTLGVDARVGEIPGEYCPGAYSVNARGATKLAGIGQRMIRGAAHMGGVVVATGADQIADVLVPVYEALELDWDPATSGSVAKELGR